MSIIQTESLRKNYRTRVKAEGLAAGIKALVRPTYQEVLAVADVSFTVEAGEMLAFIGPNGAGKSTTIKMLTGILHQTSGRAAVLGLNPQSQRQQLAARIGTVFGQRSQLWMHLPPVDSFAMLGAIYGVDDATRRKRVDMLAERFELGGFLHTPVRKLSLGQRVRCEIAASLLHEPEILFLDEPTIGLDVVVKQRIRELILEWNRKRGMTVFLTSHDPGDVEQICKRAIVIDHGQIVLDRPVETLRTDYFRRKTVAVAFNVPREIPAMDGVTLEGGGVAATLTVDTGRCPIGQVLAAVSALGEVADITVSDPPMEAVIADLFRTGGGGNHA